MISQLTINNLRNLQNIQLHFSTGFNVFFGPNGSGKTSCLEAIHYLGLGRSFRTHLAKRTINHNADNMILHAQIRQDFNHLPIGLEKNRQGETRIRIDGQNMASSSGLASLLPIQLIYPDNHSLLTSGPKTRRQYIDWGTFHVEPSFFDLWQRVQRIIKQRNACLGLGNNTNGVDAWDSELVAAANSLDQMRQAYVTQITPLFNNLLAELLGQAVEVKLSYYRGWNHETDLADVLSQHLERDIYLGYTEFGPHRADLRIKVDKTPAKDALSQGQQKIVVYALKLAQGELLQQLTGKTCLYLLDDLPAELDRLRRQKVAAVLAKLNAQVFITGVEEDELSDLLNYPETRVFHVKRGEVSSVDVPRETIDSKSAA